MRNRAALFYCFSPLLEESAALLRGARLLMKSWRRVDKDELSGITGELMTHAYQYRAQAFGQLSGGDLPATRRFYDSEKAPEDEGASSVLVVLAREFIGRFREMLIELPDGYSSDRYEWLDLVYEKLMNARYIRESDEFVTPEIVSLVGERALLLECELIASTQGRLEDAYRFNTKQTLKKKSRKTVEEMRAFAEECEIPYEWVKEVFETGHSTWWKVADEFRNKANIVRSQITGVIFDLPDDPRGDTWRAGDTSLGDVECWVPERLERAEQTAQSLIALLLSFRGNQTVSLKRIAKLTEERKL